MVWQQLPLAFELQSPLHIGFLPNQPGTIVARTRCFVPVKNLWGAVVASITPKLSNNLTAHNYQEVGRQVCQRMFFSYFYLSDGEQVFTPDYGENGLTWGNFTEREFRRRFVGACVSTALGEGGGAKEGTLHEIEFLRHQTGSPAELKKVILAGIVWVNDGASLGQHIVNVRDGSVFADDIDICERIVLGGERNYGFGRMRRVRVPEAIQEKARTWWPDNPEAEVTLDASRPLLAHIPYRKDVLFKGQIEIVAGREYPTDGEGEIFRRAGASVSVRRGDEGYCLAPGTRLITTSKNARLNPWGRLTW